MIALAGVFGGCSCQGWRGWGAGGTSDGAMILVVGDLDRWRAAGRELPSGDDLLFVRPGQIDEALIDELAPVLVLSPLREPEVDAVEVALRLVAAGYRGAFRAVASNAVTYVEIVRAEIAEVAPELDFDVIVTGARLN